MDLKIVYRKSVLSVLIFCFITSFDHVTCKTCTNPLDVMSCPKSAYLWRERSSIICVEEDEYHCLGTGTGTVIECCMTAHEISAGHFPRFNKLKMEIQEIECDKDHFMPVSLLSNKFLDNGPMHCKYQKSKCNEEGMKVCTDGSSTEDRKCKCDYMNNYKPDVAGDICFKQDNNFCSIASLCMDPDKELNMRYECVYICSVGYYRPEGELNCIPKPTTVIMPTEVSTSIKNEITIDSIGVATDEVKPRSNNLDYVTPIIATCILVGIVLVISSIILLVLIWHERKRKDKRKEPKVEIKKPAYNVKYGHPFTIVCKIENVRDYKVIWKKGKSSNNLDEVIKFAENPDKYEGESKDFPHLTVKNARKADDGFYACFIEYSVNGRTVVFPTEDDNGKNICRIHVNKRKKTQVTYQIEKQNVCNVGKVKKLNMGKTSNGIGNSDESEDSGGDSTDSQESNNSGHEDQDNTDI